MYNVIFICQCGKEKLVNPVMYAQAMELQMHNGRDMITKCPDCESISILLDSCKIVRQSG